LEYIEPQVKHYDWMSPSRDDLERYVQDFAFELDLNKWECNVRVRRQGRNLEIGNHPVGTTGFREIIRISGDEIAASVG
jgi:hypothetical protein